MTRRREPAIEPHRVAGVGGGVAIACGVIRRIL
jgi:hypothetical protein